VSELATQIGMKSACDALNVPRSTVYRAQKPKPEAKPRPTPAHALSADERARVREVLNSERFMDQAPRQVYANLLDEGRYLCHWRTMYRILSVYNEVRERRLLRRHPVYKRPELLATGPNQVWSWDITWMRGPRKGEKYALYVVIDIFSRYVVGWMIAEFESSELAKQLVAETARKQGIEPGTLTIHADNGKPMKGKPLRQLLIELGINQSHSRPHTSDDNPFSEAQFKTMKYKSDYPNRFESMDAAREWARTFFYWYNDEHYHSGLNLLTPASVHYGEADEIREQRQQVMSSAFEAHPTRFSKGQPKVHGAPAAVYINPPPPSTNLA
jgi:transposase InsO family protein